MLTLIQGTNALTVNQTRMFRPRAFSRFVARLMIGVMVFAQMALAAHACPVASGRTGDVAGGMTAMGANGAAAPSGIGDEGAADADATMPALQNQCTAHCQSGQQNADGKPAPSPAVAFLTIRYTLPALEHGGVSASQVEAANDPPLAVDPPHAVLHCCLRI